MEALCCARTPSHLYLRSLVWLGMDAHLRTDQVCTFEYPNQAEVFLNKHPVKFEADLRIKANPIVIHPDIDPFLMEPPKYRYCFRMRMAQGILTGLLHDTVQIVFHDLWVSPIAVCLNIRYELHGILISFHQVLCKTFQCKL